MSGTAVLAGYGADLLVGDPPSWHPVAGFGRAATALEDAVYAPNRVRGAAFAVTLVGAAALSVELLARTAPRGLVLAAVTWAALGGRSLRHEAERVAGCLEGGEIDAARAALRALCGRDAAELGTRELCRATVESVAENTSDAVVGALMWGAFAGPAGVTAYRAANTLDAMVGHRSGRYAEFGYSAAKLDDVMSWPAARISVALTALCAPVVGGSWRRVLEIAGRDGGEHPSPNAGRIEAAFAGALGVRLGGPLAYAGAVEHRPHLGDGEAPELGDIHRATRLSLAVGTAAAGLGSAVATARAAGTRRSAEMPGAAGPTPSAGAPHAAPRFGSSRRGLGLPPVVTFARLSGKSDHGGTSALARRASARPPTPPAPSHTAPHSPGRQQ
ncbi:MAG TPA: adenosylcobinamide-phosphate synthase CbiB [Solirubrobacteraceae bacterium]|nr:adenosylcobinamide-phosphate synthase CbiB [Solirubrobacteraceae bacterium]